MRKPVSRKLQEALNEFEIRLPLPANLYRVAREHYGSEERLGDSAILAYIRHQMTNYDEILKRRSKMNQNNYLLFKQKTTGRILRELHKWKNERGI